MKAYAKKFISIGQLNSNVIESYVDKNRITRVSNFIDYNERASSQPSKFDSLVVVGRPSPEKGLVELFRFLQKAKVGRKIIVVGASEDEYRGVNLNGLNIDFTGWVDKKKVSEMMERSRFMIFPSLWYEGAPLVVQDAIAMGLPVLCANVNAGAEAVKEYEAGAVYDPYIYASFEESYKELEDDDFLSACSERSYSKFWREPPTLNKHIESVVTL